MFTNTIQQILGYFSKLKWEDLILAGLRILVILVIMWIAFAILKRLLNRLQKSLIHRAQAEGEGSFESTKRVETLTRLLRQAVVILIWVVAILIILRQIGIDVGPILASAGILGLAIGFGAQNLVKDIIAGFFIILENQVRVGDVAIINGTGGLVERVDFRTLVLRDLAGIVYVFPNGSITTLANMTREWSAFVLDIGVAYKEDTDKVVELMKKVGDELRADGHFGPLMTEAIEIFGVDKLDESAVIIKGRIKTKPASQWEAGREYLRRLKQTFDANGIEIPFPHRSIYFGENSKPILAQLLNTEQKSDKDTSG